jgi:tetratricopeptide (TPR) repeat protein
MARVLMAMNIGYATDVWGDVPFTEAFKGVNNFSPKYDTQEQVIAQIQSYLDKAIADFAKPASANSVLPGKNDLFFYDNKNFVWQKDKWIKLAYAIKARYALRLSKVDASAAQKALDYSQKALASNSDNLIATFDGGNNQNLWYGFNNSRSGYMSMGKYFVDLLVNNNDPRLSYFVGKDANGGYSGSAPEDADSDASVFGGYFAGTAATSNVIVSYSEIKFIQAEAYFRLGQTASAQAALKEAISSSIKDVTEVNDDAFATAASATVTLENIITQKYIALFTTAEPYNDWRRTGFPNLTPNQESQTKKIPVRLITPKSERTLNANATVVSSMYTPVWWAK